MSRTGRFFYIVVVCSIVFKFWLLSEIRTAPEFAPHDASNYLTHARAIVVGHWFGGYDDLTLIKQPFFPIYLAIVEQIGLPLTTANILLDALAAFAVCIAVNPLLGRRTIAALFLVLFFNPYSFDILAWTSDRSVINPALGLLTIACAAAVYVRRASPVRVTLRWLFALGIALSAFWLTREDAVWLVPAVAVILGAYALWSFKRRPDQFSIRLASLVLPFAMCFLSVVSIMFINGRVYGWKVTNEQQAPEFVSAYNSLVRIDVPKKRYIPLPRTAREIAYSVSAAARELRPSFEGPNGDAWVGNTCSGMPELCNEHEIGGGWASWALRDAVQNAGHYINGASARAFYTQLAKEIDDACSAGKIKCLSKARAVFPPSIPPGAVPDIFKSFENAINHMLAQDLFGIGRPGMSPIPESLRQDYDLVARSVLDAGVQQRFTGWVLYNHVRPPTVEGADAQSAQLIFSPASPDVAAYFAKDKRFTAAAKNSARFELLTDCDDNCTLVVPGASGRPVRIPLTEQQLDFAAPGVLYHIDGEHKIAEFDHDWKTRITFALANAFLLIYRPLVILALLLLIVRCVRSVLRRRFAAPWAIITFAAVLSSVLYIALLSVMDALAFRAIYGGYLNAPTMQLLFVASLMVLIEAKTVYRLARRSLAARTVS